MADNITRSQLDFTQITETIASAVASNGWKRCNAGETGRIDYNYRFNLYIRRRKLSDLVSGNDGILKMSSKTPQITSVEMPSKTTDFGAFSETVSKEPMGNPQKNLTPCPVSPITKGNESLPILSAFTNYPSLAAARINSPALVIAFDSEWYYPEGDEKRMILSWQFSLIAGEELVEYVFIRKNAKYALSLELAIGRILGSLPLEPVDVRSVRRYASIIGKVAETGKPETALFKTRDDALQNSTQAFADGKEVHVAYDWSGIQSLPVVLLCHAGKVDVSGFDQSMKGYVNILNHCTEVQGGLVTLKPTHVYAQSLAPEHGRNHNPHIYPISLRIADTMCHAPAGMKSLKALGKVVGWEKIQLAEDDIENMDQLLMNDPCAYFEYAANDSNVTLLYESALYGYDNEPPVTITSATAKIMRNVMMEYLRCKNNKQFNRKYRGLQKVGHGLVPKKNRPGYVENTSLEPISDKANTVQYYASQAYRGGYNGSSEIGYFPQVTFDYDLQNAYPTAMCLVSDVDWENPIRSEINNRELTLQDFVVPIIGGYAPLTMMLAYVRFEFPADVKYPCIPINVDGGLVFPRTSKGIDGIYACGPELFLALKLGAKVFVERGYILNSIVIPETGELSYSLRAAVKQLVEDRNMAKAEHGKGSLEELILKTMVNSGYGKNAQNVIQKSAWSAYKKEMENLGCSPITNPVSAAMITSIVRAELLAAQNQCHGLGYMTCSVTTDGFISDVPADTLKSLDLFGLRPFMEQARMFLTNGGNAEIWEIKHCQDDLLNITTRGNVSLHSKTNPMIFDGKQYEGVCAHNSTKSGYEPDSYEDRFWLMTQVLKRTGTVNYTDIEWTTFKDLANGKDFETPKKVNHIRMDFDMKRKPDRNSFCAKTVTVEGNAYEIANFSTLPFDTVAEYKEYRQRKSTVSCLRMMEDWEIFWFKTDAKNSNIKVRDMDWAILNSCIIGHRAGFWVIPKLNELQGAERDAWINSHNISSKLWRPNDWKNAGRNSRQANMLPREMLEEKLQEMINE